MRALVLVVAGCAAQPEPPAFDGTWVRYDDQGRMIERLVIDGPDLYSRATYFHDPVWWEETRATWRVSTVDDRQLWIDGTTRSETWEIPLSFGGTFYLDEDHLVIGAFVPVGGQGYRAVRRYRERLDIEMLVSTTGFLAWWIDPIWGDPVTEGGNATWVDDTVVIGDTVTLRAYPDGTLGGDDPLGHLFDHGSFWHMGTTFRRVR